MTQDTFLVGIDFGSFKTSITASNGRRDSIRTAGGWPKDHVARALLGSDHVFGERIQEAEMALDIVRPFAHGGLKYGPLPEDEMSSDQYARRCEAAPIRNALS